MSAKSSTSSFVQHDKRTLQVYYQNVRGLNTKINELFDSTAGCQVDYDVIAFTETWLNSSVKNSELFDLNFVVFRSDRDFGATNKSRGGGVLLAVKSSISSRELNISDYCDTFKTIKFIDICLIQLDLKHNKLLLLVLYIPPLVTFEHFETLLDGLESLYILFGNSLLILGDFNIPEFSTQKNFKNNLSNKMSRLSKFSEFYHLEQFNLILNHLQRTLDLVYSNMNCSVIDVSDFPLMTIDQHHPPLLITLNKIDVSSGVDPIPNDSYNFRKCDFINLYKSLCDINWDALYEYRELDSACDFFYNTLYTTLDIFVPKYIPHQSKYPPWFDSTIIKNIKLKSSFWKKYKLTNCNEAYSDFKKLRTKIKKDSQSARTRYLLNIEQNIKSDPKRFWSYLRNKKETSNVPLKMSYLNEELNSPQEIVNGFATFFNNTYIKASTIDNNNHCSSIQSGTTLIINSFSSEEIISAIKRLKDNFTTGPDLMPAFFVRDSAFALVDPLKFIFNLALQKSEFPIRWKTVRLCPVIKSGAAGDVANYRPIAIISNFAKVFEILLHKQMCFHVKNLIKTEQHGFMSGRSTTTNLATLTQFVSCELDKQTQVDVIYTDFSKAFDRLDHGVLLKKLHSFGLSDALVDLMKSYLCNRSQFVQLKGYQSSTFPVPSGVPQGTIIGPLLFNIFVNDIIDNLEGVHALLYADDIKIFKTINNFSDCEALQNNLELLNEWCISNRLPLNLKKCNVMSFTRRTSMITYPYGIDDCILERQTTFNDLGVTFDQKLTFNFHVNNIVSSVYKTLGFIIRNSKDFSDTKTLCLLFNTFIRSKLEYCSVVWSPSYMHYSNELEKIQRKFLKFLSFKIDGTYPKQGFPQELLLQRFDQQYLSLRRKCNSVVFLQKLIDSTFDCPELLEQVNFNVPRITSRQPRTFSLTTPRTRHHLDSPIFTLCNNYDSSKNNIEGSLDIFCCSVNDIRRAILTL